MTTTANPLVARSAAESPSPWAGVWIAEDIEQIATGVKSGDWISGTLGTFGGLDALALVSDPAGDVCRVCGVLSIWMRDLV